MFTENIAEFFMFFSCAFAVWRKQIFTRNTHESVVLPCLFDQCFGLVGREPAACEYPLRQIRQADIPKRDKQTR